jgi:hypothetical protein
MAVFSIWESRFPPQRAEEGLGVTRAIWEDMLGFAGYLDHEVVRDLDDQRAPDRGEPLGEPGGRRRGPGALPREPQRREGERASLRTQAPRGGHRRGHR